MNTNIIHCSIAFHDECDDGDNCNLSALSNKQGTIWVKSIHDLIQADELEEFLFTANDQSVKGIMIEKRYLQFHRPIFGED